MTPPPTNIVTPAPITIGMQTVTPNSVSQYLIANQTLVPGGPALIVFGTLVSLALGATAVVVGYKYERGGESYFEWSWEWKSDSDDFGSSGVHRWDGGTGTW